ncbi:MAG: tRNA pseudouridine(38-40) synthase TruA [Clostridia bacterium]|nr:tRNA pseudouridine(38-40) synthase TruA [Clostridia bacterium]
MRNILLTIKYLGTAYSGWQVQANAPSVQQTLQDAVEKLFGVRENVVGCSRTDAGVHANMYCCNVRTSSSLPCDVVVRGLNAHLPDDIAVLSCRDVDYDFHARYDCCGKEYIYIIHNSHIRDPFLLGRSWDFKKQIDADFLNEQAQGFVGTHDFKAFCASGSSVQSTVRTVKSFRVTRDGENVIMSVKADGFLYNMVRIMVGTLTDITLGRIKPDTIPEIIASCERKNAGVTAPPQGLYLNRVYYSGEEL